MTDQEYIQVEVNEENILRFNLPLLTGNKTEDLLVAAKEAALAGHVLTCRVPKPAGYEVEINVFDAARTQPAPDDAYIRDATIHDVSITADPLPGYEFRIVDEVVQGEVVDVRDETDDLA